MVAMLGLGAPAALAAANTQRTYNNGLICVVGTAKQYPATPWTFTNSATYAEAEPYYGDCATPLYRDQGQVATKADVYRWNGSSWSYCTGTDWKYGGYRAQTTSGGFTVGPSYGASTWGPVAGSCGAGYYGVNAAAYVWYAGQWLGGWVWSGYEYIS